MKLDTDTPEFQRAWAKIVAQSWADENFKKRLIADPVPVLREHGVDVPEGTTLSIDQLPLSSLFEEKLANTSFAPVAAAGSSSQGAMATGMFYAAWPGALSQPQPSSWPLGQPTVGGVTAGTAGTAGTIGSVCGTAGCVFCSGSAGTAVAAPGGAPSGAGSTPLGQTAGGVTAGTAGTAGSLGSVCGTAGCVFTTGTAGTAVVAPGAAPGGAISTPLGQTMAAAPTVGSAGTVGSFGTICGSAACLGTSATAGSRPP